MTSLAFVLGVSPLMLSHGAGAEMRRTLGTAVFSGMLGVTIFGLFLTPVFFYVINKLSESRWLNSPAMRKAREISLGILGLGYVRQLGPYVRKWRESWRPRSSGPDKNDN